MTSRSLLAAVVLVAATACTGDGSGAPSYELTEFAISGPRQLEADGSPLTISNSGSFAHTLLVTTPSGDVVAATDLIQPGETADLAVELRPGVYQFTCRIVVEAGDGRIVDHFQEGMHTVVEVSA